MCIVSKVLDQQCDFWRQQTSPPGPFAEPRYPSKDEIEAFIERLKAAKGEDAEQGNPDCQMDEKVQKIKDLANDIRDAAQDAHETIDALLAELEELTDE